METLKIIIVYYNSLLGFPGGTMVKNPPDHARDVRDMSSIPGLGSSLK